MRFFIQILIPFNWGKKLSDVVFHAKVGMMDAKVARIETLAVAIATTVVGGMNVPMLRQAAKLCKADLTSGMVGEFPEVQGIMGTYYATHDGEHADVAAAAAVEVTERNTRIA